jgi:hypothetical protein
MRSGRQLSMVSIAKAVILLSADCVEKLAVALGRRLSL